jgi:signal transduction histidine kinase
VAPKPLRLGVSTKIFLGYAVVIGAFGGACVYTLYRMGALRTVTTLAWQDVAPLAQELRTLSRHLRAPEDFLDLERPTDHLWLARFLAHLEPFEGMQRIEKALALLEASGPLTEDDRQALARVRLALERARTGNDLAAVGGDEALSQVIEGASDNPRVFERVIDYTVRRAQAAELVASSPELRATKRMLLRLNRAVVEAHRELNVAIRGLDERASADARNATLAVILTTAGALVVSLLMLLVSHLTLAPIRKLRASARRIAEGHLDEEVEIGSHDELGQLGLEFNTMARALRARDLELERQREELLRRERLATIGKLAAQITHEIRNPLSSIGLNVELLEEEVETAGGKEAKALLAAIQAEVERLRAITEDYLRYARMPRAELDPVELRTLCGALVEFLSSRMHAHAITCRIESAAGSELVPVEGDADQLRQALLNVLDNAIEILRNQPPPRDVLVRIAAAQGGIAVEVRDTGPGIDPELAAHLFEPFVTGRPGGTGLGLALTQQIMSEHGGSVEARSPLDGGRGSAFVLWLPRASPRVVVDPSVSG